MKLLEEADKTWEAGRWIFAKRLDESRLAEGRPPLMSELDVISRPVFISDRGKHYTLVNRAAFEALAIPMDTTRRAPGRKRPATRQAPG